MDIAELLGQNERVMKDLGKRFADTEAAMVRRPLAASEARVTKLENRLKALADERAETIARIDADIASVKSELKSLKSHVDTETKRLAPMEAAMRKSTATVARTARKTK
jgi:chromosome segregation ATPase